MSSKLEIQISELLTKESCPFCLKKVLKTNLAGFQHQKDHPFFLKKPICQECWDKNSNLNSQFFSSLELIKNTNQKLQNWIKSYKERKNNNPVKKEEKVYEDWQKKTK